MHRAHDFHFFIILWEKEQNVLTPILVILLKPSNKRSNVRTNILEPEVNTVVLKKRAIQFLPVICLRKKGFLQDCTIKFFQITKTKSCKVWTFWEAHKIWKNLSHGFDKLADLLSKRQNHEENCAKICGLLVKTELYTCNIAACLCRNSGKWQVIWP